MRLGRWIGAIAGIGLLAAVTWIGISVTMPGRVPSTSTPRRIASVTLGTDEILAELVPAERVVCVTYLVDDPEISNVPGRYPERIPRLREANSERIIDLNADLVCVAPYNSADFLKVLERSGLAIYRNDAYHSIDAIEIGILALGDRVGEPVRADEIVGRMRARRQRLAERLRDVSKRPRVLYWSAGFTAGRGSTIDDVIREAGGINIAAERKDQSAEISPEQVIAADPDYILSSKWFADERNNAIENHPLLRSLRAVAEKRVIAIEARFLTTVSQFVVEGEERLARRLHPDRFENETP
jgi:iron complex transport system substrate-binding protein